ncbi:MAG: hypothetical protein GTO12_07155 [Proteobacteria bacterium]|nr:hypothetical protein [Pseudomonadota bacterium]
MSHDKQHTIKLASLVSAVLFLFLFSPGCTGSEAQNQNPGYVEGQLLVKFKKTISPERIEEINEMMGTQVIKVISQVEFYQLRIPEDMTVPEMVSRYSALPEVEHAEPNYLYRIAPLRKE